jgi:hypothetical protein
MLKIGLTKSIGMDASPRMWMGQLISIPKILSFLSVYIFEDLHTCVWMHAEAAPMVVASLGSHKVVGLKSEENRTMFKKLSNVMMVGIANLILMSAAVAGDTVEISVDAKKANGDKLQVDVSGPDVMQLTGMARLSCSAGDTCLALLTTSSLDASSDCLIHLHGPGGSTYVVIDICGGTDPTEQSVPTVSVNDEFGDDLTECFPEPTCDHEQFASVRDKLKLVMKGK